MTTEAPKVVVLAGPNGAGKSTLAPKILRGPLGVSEFVNADLIARGLSAFAPEQVALAAGRVARSRIKELVGQRASLAFETTLASRSFAPWLAELVRSGYEFHLVFVWLPSADAAVARVAERVRAGGHAVDEATVRRRYQAGLRNFFELYQERSTSWQVLNNSGRTPPRLVALGSGRRVEEVRQPRVWQRMQEGYHGGV
jgi:predicted ABC-type ATPase